MTDSPLKSAVLVGGLRLPFMKMGTNLSQVDLLEMLVLTLDGMINKFKLHGETIDDVALGSTFFHPNYWNIARDTVLRSSLSPKTPALGIQRACATSLEASISIINKIALGQIQCGLAGGAESMSNLPIFLQPALARRMVLNSKAKSWAQRLDIWKGIHLSDLKPMSAPGVELSTGKSMGEHCEMMVKEWKIDRRAQDELSLKSHQCAGEALKKGFYDDLILEFNGTKVDNTVRSDTSLEKLAKLKPAFDFSGEGTLTAGNSSPFTDGAAMVFFTSEAYAKQKNLPILARIVDFETTAVDIRKEGLLMAPAFAVPKMLQRQKLKLQDFDFYEIHEAFAGQVLCTLKAWESDEFCIKKAGLDFALGTIDFEKLNVAGGSVALGHPFAATGARIVATLGKLLSQKGSGRGLVSICTGGGMGTTMILEAP